jgi:hypothetical protein
MRGTWVMRNGRLVRKEYAAPLNAASSAAYVISDTMEPLKHMGTGRMIDSKSKFRADTRASGCVEVGTDPAALRSRPRLEPRGVHMDVKRALEELRSR